MSRSHVQPGRSRFFRVPEHPLNVGGDFESSALDQQLCETLFVGIAYADEANRCVTPNGEFLAGL